MLETVEGFIVKETSYGETSKIINVFTKERGIVGVYARGCKSLKSRNRVSTLPLTYAKFNIKYKQDKLSTLISADIIDDFAVIKSDILKISYFNYIIDLSVQVFKECLNINIYTLMKNSIIKINSGLDPAVITNILETKYLYYLGCNINLTICSNCGKEEQVTYIDINTKDVLCSKCNATYSDKFAKVISLVSKYQELNIENVKNISIDKDINFLINQLIKNYYNDLTGIYVHSKEFLENMLGTSK